MAKMCEVLSKQCQEFENFEDVDRGLFGPTYKKYEEARGEWEKFTVPTHIQLF